MARRSDDTDGVFTAEEAKKVEEIEKSPIEELRYEIVPT